MYIRNDLYPIQKILDYDSNLQLLLHVVIYFCCCFSIDLVMLTLKVYSMSIIYLCLKFYTFIRFMLISRPHREPGLLYTLVWHELQDRVLIVYEFVSLIHLIVSCYTYELVYHMNLYIIRELLCRAVKMRVGSVLQNTSCMMFLFS